MKTVGIICEYNPFHTGHLHHINTARGGSVICLMSGNFTQRGEPAITDKFTRATAACAAGADLVLELPFPYCAASADYFAGAGVAILDELGTDEINFGSETGDLERLISLARAAADPEFDKKYKEILAADPTLGTAETYFLALGENGVSELASNDLLGLSYAKAATRIGCEEKLRVTARDGSAYGAKVVEEGKHPSATALRSLLHVGNLSAFSMMPDATAEILKKAPLTDIKNLEGAILTFFRLADPERLSECAEAGGGLAHRLCSAARSATTLDEFFTLASAKRYTDARVRRATLFCMLGVTKKDLCTPPSYLQLLAANARGRELLGRLKKESQLPIVTKPADAERLSPRQFELSARADALYTLAFSEKKAADVYIKSAPMVF